jgi:hypothetical protein
MTNIFLREIHLKDFRTFGDFALSIPPGPGLTLLVGTNGLGKSSFFDGIEWCLTGTIRRFLDYVGRLNESEYLTRRDAEAGTHRVSLTFSEGEPLIRALHEHPAVDVLVDLLKDPRWTDINDVGAYLGFTHFLGQASQQRFTNRGESDQWQALKGPSGIDRLESIRAALRGRTTTLAFRRRIEREENAINIAVRALEGWKSNTVRLAELEARGAAAGAETAVMLDERLSAIEQALLQGSQAAKGFTERLAIVRAAVEAEQRKVAQNRAGIEDLYSIFARFSETSSLIDSGNERLAAADAAIAAITAEVSEAMLAATRAEQEAAAQAEIVALTEAQHSECIHVRGAIVEFGVLSSELLTLQADEAILKAERDTCQADVASAKAMLSRANEVQATISRLNNEEATLRLWSKRAGELHALEVAARTKRNAASDASAAADRARSQSAELERAFKEACDTEATAIERFSARRRNASQFAELLSGIAAHIEHDDTSCPVCATTFLAGELQTLARNALNTQDAQLADDVRALDVLRDRRMAAAAAHAQSRSLIETETASAAAAAEAEAAVAGERAALADGLGLSVDSDFPSVIAERLAATTRLRATHIRDDGGSTTDISSAQSRVDALAAALASLSERLATALQRRIRCETALRAIEESLDGHPKPWNVEAADTALKAQRKLLDDARASLEGLALKRAATANFETEVRGRHVAAKAERDRIVGAVHDAKASRAAVLDRWQQAGMNGEPSSQVVEAREVALAKTARAVAEYLDETNALSRSHEAFLSQSELRTLRALMDKQGGEGAADNPAVYAQQLQEELRAKRAALQLTTATRDAVVAYGEQLKTEAESFSTQFLLPLNDLIDGFNRALLSTPGAAVQFSAEHTVARTSLAMQLRYADAADNAQYTTTLPPQLVLSEGQMAANGFSILCAASTAYRWSRWRGLLLDDPLQHNDIIHGAAFVDVMRNLVEHEGYQLLMSTHKREEGEFIARKFDAAGLPCTVVELVGASRDGVRISQPRHNAAARRLLVEPESRLSSSF